MNKKKRIFKYELDSPSRDNSPYTFQQNLAPSLSDRLCRLWSDSVIEPGKVDSRWEIVQNSIRVRRRCDKRTRGFTPIFISNSANAFLKGVGVCGGSFPHFMVVGGVTHNSRFASSTTSTFIVGWISLCRMPRFGVSSVLVSLFVTTAANSISFCRRRRLTGVDVRLTSNDKFKFGLFKN